jgi:hypothetical protein
VVRVGSFGEVLHMTRDDRVRRALSTLAEADSRCHAPSHVESALLEAFDRSVHKRHSVRNAVVAWPLRLTAVAAALLLAASGAIYVLGRDRGAGTARADRPPVAAAHDEVLSPNASSKEPPLASRDDHLRRSVSRTRTTVHRRDLVSDADATIAAYGEFDGVVRVVRMRLTRATLPLLGIPIIDPNAAGTVEIELLVGEDGLARTIRTVR